MRLTVLFDKKGMTLVEVIIAMFLFLIVSMALLQASIVSVSYNTMSGMREEATNIAEARMADTTSRTFTSDVDNVLTAGDTGTGTSTGCPQGFPASGVKVLRTIENASVTFCTNVAVAAVGDDAREITVRVEWKWKGAAYAHKISSIVRKT